MSGVGLPRESYGRGDHSTCRPVRLYGVSSLAERILDARGKGLWLAPSDFPLCHRMQIRKCHGPTTRNRRGFAAGWPSASRRGCVTSPVPPAPPGLPPQRPPHSPHANKSLEAQRTISLPVTPSCPCPNALAGPSIRRRAACADSRTAKLQTSFARAHPSFAPLQCFSVHKRQQSTTGRSNRKWHLVMGLRCRREIGRGIQPVFVAGWGKFVDKM